MKVLSNPTGFDQTHEPDPAHFEECGQCCTASIATDAGHLTSPTDVTEWIEANGHDEGGGEAEVSHGTSVAEQVAFLNHLGIPAQARYAPLRSYAIQAIDAGRRAVVAVYCDRYANPVPPARAITGHFMEAYGYEIAADGHLRVLAMQPWGNRRVWFDNLEACDQRAGYDAGVVLPADQPKPANQPPVEDDMKAIIFWALDRNGSPGACFCVNFQTWRWIENEQQLADLRASLGRVGVAVVDWNTPDKPVADIDTFGIAADPESAAQFPATAGS